MYQHIFIPGSNDLFYCLKLFQECKWFDICESFSSCYLIKTAYLDVGNEVLLKGVIPFIKQLKIPEVWMLSAHACSHQNPQSKTFEELSICQSCIASFLDDIQSIHHVNVEHPDVSKDLEFLLI